jgi:Uma2 family endonuclease
MTTTTQRGLTLEQFLSRPETKPAAEYACEEAHRKPMPNAAHMKLQGYLTLLLLQFLAHTSLGVAGPEWRCIFGPRGKERSYVPDLAYASFDRYPRGDLRDEPYLRAAPDLAVEILSPGQNARRFASKLRFYLRHGVRMVWVIDARDESITVYAPDEDELLLHPGDTLDGGDVLPGFTVPVADIFAQLHV